MDIKDVRHTEMIEIIDFYNFIEEYGHIFGGKNEELDPGFNSIIIGIEAIRKLVNDHYGR